MEALKKLTKIVQEAVPEVNINSRYVCTHKGREAHVCVKGECRKLVSTRDITLEDIFATYLGQLEVRTGIVSEKAIMWTLYNITVMTNWHLGKPLTKQSEETIGSIIKMLVIE